jgi:hypothetical protein
MTEPYVYELPPTVACPGCGNPAVLPAFFEDDLPLAICGTCGSEIPDPRRELAAAAPAGGTYGADGPYGGETEDTPAEDKRYTRSGLLSALRDTVAEKGIAAINKRTPPSFRG